MPALPRKPPAAPPSTPLPGARVGCRRSPAAPNRRGLALWRLGLALRSLHRENLKRRRAWSYRKNEEPKTVVRFTLQAYVTAECDASAFTIAT